MEKHGRAFPTYLGVLWDTYNDLVAQMLDAEDTNPALYDSLDQELQGIEEHIRWVARQKDYEMPSALPETKTDKIDFAALKERIDLREYVERYTVLRQNGRTLKGRCPLPDHAEKTPSFFVYPETNSWWCYGCRQGSDIFDFVAKMEGLKPSDLARDE